MISPSILFTWPNHLNILFFIFKTTLFCNNIIAKLTSFLILSRKLFPQVFRNDLLSIAFNFILFLDYQRLASINNCWHKAT